MQQLYIVLFILDDGRVTRHEYTTYITDATPSLQDFAHILFDDYDMNKDHHLDKLDYNAYYAKVDANGMILYSQCVCHCHLLFVRVRVTPALVFSVVVCVLCLSFRN